MEAPVRRMAIVLLTLLVLGVVTSIWRGDAPGTTVGLAVVGLAAGGFVFGCYLYARRRG